jgi:hypothetical protein
MSYKGSLLEEALAWKLVHQTTIIASVGKMVRTRFYFIILL